MVLLDLWIFVLIYFTSINDKKFNKRIIILSREIYKKRTNSQEKYKKSR